MLSELGVPLKLDIPRDAERELAAQRIKGVRPSKRRKSAVATQNGDRRNLGSSDVD
jgi:hypothetical protein